MDPTIDWQRVYDIFTKVMDTPESERNAKIEALCGGDAALKRAVRTAVRESMSPNTDVGFEEPVQQIMQQMVSESVTHSPSRAGGKIKHFYLQKLIGQGGQGEVYKAWDEKLQRPLALKFISKNKPLTEQALERFQDEAKAIAAVEHDHICRLYDLDVTDEGIPFLVMELLDGTTLDQKIKLNGPLQSEEAKSILKEICGGLAAAHSKKLIHKDIKPSNILLVGPQEKVKITDFGIAEWAELPSTPKHMGTLPYMSPEQLIKEPLDYRTDIWSLGVIYYEMLSGANPLKNPKYGPAQCLDMIQKRSAFPTLEAFSEQETHVLNQCLQPERNQRPSSVAALIDQLKAAENEVSNTPERKEQLSPYVYAAVGLVLIIFVAILGLNQINRNEIPGSSVAIMWAEESDPSPTIDWINFQLESILSGPRLTSARNIVLINPSTGFSTTSRVIEQHNPASLVRLSLMEVDAEEVLRIQLREPSNLDIVDAASLSLDGLNHTSAHQFIRRLLDLLDIDLDDRGLYLALYNSRADPQAIDLFERARETVERAGSMQDLDTAIEMLKSSTEFDSSFVLSHAWLSNAYVMRYNFTGSPADLEAASQADITANRLDPNKVLRYTNYFSQGLLHQARRNYEESFRAFEKAIALDPTQGLSYVGAAEALAEMGRFEPAESYFREAFRVDSTNTEVLVSIGVHKFDHEQYEEAAHYFQRTIDIDPLHKAAHRNLGACYERMEDLESAVASYEKALEIEPDYITLNNLAVVYYMDEDFAEAIATWKKAIELNPEIHYLWGGLGFSYNAYPDSFAVRDEAFRLAIALADSSLKDSPNDPTLLIPLCEYHLELQDSVKSRYFLEKAAELKLTPGLQSDFDGVQRRLEE